MISIRPALVQDVHAICRLDAMLLGSTSRSANLHRWIAQGECHVVTQGHQVCAYAVMNQSFFGQSLVVLLMVDPRNQKQGIGRALLTYLESICPTEKLFVSTNLTNKRMQRLLLTAGYTPCGMIDALDPGDPELFYYKKPPHH
ncbi:GNAT family N-acetyltransferase [Brevibacillus ruminantium]|uniref:GNAT family N-acetyltransferase n=1 Tax=Brevibacillus ruminantium TaxID=2950604 RepID=A0ABY4WIU2_9BACL|nr:GNAT family N-acetyltransferase [Brevibacillus ruminantium]USG65957.1 GNAT family N-acetyltransferase [Brevibacillus ruminantium]